MAVTSRAPDLNLPAVASPKEKKGRSKCPGVRLIGGRIYDSDNGITCHQCRQKTRDFSAHCKHLKEGKPCPIKYCHKCLLNRYGEKAEEVVLLDDWECPRCRGICNCSCCRKKRGHAPTGILVRAAKENGFSSVSELLQVKGAENYAYKRVAKDVVISSTHPVSSKESVIDSPMKPGKENSVDGKIVVSSHSEKLMKPCTVKESMKKRRKGLQELNNGNGENDHNLVASSPKKPRLDEGVATNKVKTKEKIKKDKKMEDMKPIIESQNAPGEVMMNGASECCNVAEKVESKTQMSNVVFCLPVSNKAETSKTGGVPDVVKNNNNVETKRKKSTKSCKINKSADELLSKKFVVEDIPLPLATSLIAVAGIELPNEVVGDALQFLEFCAAFGQALDLKKGQAEAVIREIMNYRRGRRLQGSLSVQFQIKLLSLIQEDIGERPPTLNAENGTTLWLNALKECVSNCNFMSVELSSGSFDSNEKYASLNASQKLKLLNFLCDEALGTNNLRSWIDDQDLKFVERKKEAKEKILAAKEKKKLLKQKIQDEVAKAIMGKNGATLSLSEHRELVSQIKKESALAHAEMLEAMELIAPKRIERSDAVRTDPLFLDENGRAFWRLKGHKDVTDILLQDMGVWDSVPIEEKWFVYAAEQKEGIEKYISSLRTKRLRVQEAAAIPLVGDDETDL
ncbi:Zinc-finger domain of monoamine-oxidase A repressor R1 protein [Euphorbia peplus]|nr:Zinc-finger domain of monoamine-oxidase A repressor R1 protein [Euphorbia peplus]